MTYFIIRDILIMIYLFYYLHKKFEEDEWSNKYKSKKRHFQWDGGSSVYGPLWLVYIPLFVHNIVGALRQDKSTLFLCELPGHT